MEHFLDGHHVWLRSLERGLYLYADEDGQGVSLRSRQASHNAAWTVHLLHDGGNRVLLQGAAYGRYLSATGWSAQPGHRGLRTQQREFDFAGMRGLLTWQVVTGPGNTVKLLNVAPSGYTRYLRANGRYLQWNRGVTMEAAGTVVSTMMHWVVQPIPPRDSMPPLPLHAQPVHSDNERNIFYVRADPDGGYRETDWEGFSFTGRSVNNLMSELSQIVCGEGPCVRFAMCARASRLAHLAPIVVDLPRNNDPIRVVILMQGTPAFQALRHPNVDAE